MIKFFENLGILNNLIYINEKDNLLILFIFYLFN